VRTERNGMPGSMRYLRTVVGMTSLVVTLGLTSCSTEATPTSTNSSTAAAATTQGPDEVTPLVGSVPFAPIPFVGSDDKNTSSTNYPSRTSPARR
jgi:hypothetical protein